MDNITTINNEQIAELVGIVKEQFPAKSQKKYQDTLAEFEVKLQTVQVDEYPNAEEFVLECLTLFDGEEEEGPEEIYKGLSRHDILIFMNSIVRRFKEVLCDTFRQHPDQNFADATADVYNESVKILVASVLHAAGIPSVFTAVMMSAFLTYISKSGIQEICR